MSRSRAARLLGLGVLVACRGPDVRGAASGAPTLVVEAARLAPASGDEGARLALRGSFRGLMLDPSRPVRIEVGESARWVQLRRRWSGVLEVRSEEHGYALEVDPMKGRFVLIEPGVVRRNPLRVALGQEATLVCVRLHFREEADGWTFDAARDRQRPCESADHHERPPN